MNKEVHYEGWLIKSPPSKRIWRSRWRRRWFTLKQGEIPEQFCLEYYTDRNCRKLKGIIDLDQCEQVDCGLRLENRKQKFQYMFDIKTPKRTYYLAADSAEDMRYWVNCICQVCHLHDTKHSLEENVKWRSSNNKNANSAEVPNNALSGTDNQNKEISQEKLSIVIPSPIYYNNVFKNREFTYANSEHSSSELLNNLSSVSNNVRETTSTINLTTVPSNNETNIYLNTSIISNRNQNRISGATRKVPQNLKLQNAPLLETLTLSVQPSPSLSTCSGPYIPISECFSGTSKYLENPITPLNNLDPKFYDTPRSHYNIGLNLTNDQSYSPKITNCNATQITTAANCVSVNRSDSESESVFTDDDDWTYPMPLRENVDRNARPSDSSVENESFVLTYSQRFSKLPDVNDKVTVFKYNVDTEKKNQPIEIIKKHKNKQNLSLDIKNNGRTLKEILQLSDTENTSPAIGPLDANSIVEESYDIPRSHQLPYHNIDHIFKEKMWSLETEELATKDNLKSNAQNKMQKHFYTNAAPNKLEGNVFRYDFVQHTDLPPVNRKLKPKLSINSKLHERESENQCLPEKPIKNAFIEGNLSLSPPTVDRNLKPNLYKAVHSSLLEHGMRRSVDMSSAMEIMSEIDECILETRTLPRKTSSLLDRSNNARATDISVIYQRSISSANSMYHEAVEYNPLQKNTRNEHRLQYFDLDVTNPPTINWESISTSNLTKQESNNVDLLPKSSLKTSVVYNSVDFVKTEAFKRIREERKKESEGVSSK